METVTSNEGYVRLRIYEGDLKIDDAARELLALEKAQHAATRVQLKETREKYAKAMSVILEMTR